MQQQYVKYTHGFVVKRTLKCWFKDAKMYRDFTMKQQYSTEIGPRWVRTLLLLMCMTLVHTTIIHSWL